MMLWEAEARRVFAILKDWLKEMFWCSKAMAKLIILKTEPISKRCCVIIFWY